VKKPEGGIHVG